MKQDSDNPQGNQTMSDGEQVTIDKSQYAKMVKSQNHYERILEAEAAVEVLRARREATKTAARSALQQWKEATDKLGELISEGANDPQMQLFPPESEGGDVVAQGFDDEIEDDEEDDDASPEPATAWTGANDWREKPIGSMAITEKQKDKLRDIGVRNLGQFKNLYDGNAPGMPNGLADVNGFGDKAVLKIIEAAKKVIPGLEDKPTEEDQQGKTTGLKLAETPEEDEAQPHDPSDATSEEGEWEDVDDDEGAETGVAETVADDQNGETVETETQQSEEPAQSAGDDDDEESVKIVLTKDISRLGLHKGDELQGRPFGNGVLVTLDGGKPMTFTTNEYQRADSVSA